MTLTALLLLLTASSTTLAVGGERHLDLAVESQERPSSRPDLRAKIQKRLDRKRAKLAKRPRPYDQPAEAQEFFAAKRLPPGQSVLPVERYLQAIEHAKRMRRHSTTLGSRVSLGATMALEASVPSLDLGTWTPLGPGNIGGRTRVLLIHPTTPTTMYAAGVAGGIWKTTSGGAGWTPLADLLPNIAVNSMAMDPNDPETIYVGTGEGFFNIDAVRGAGMFRTTDGGMTWSHLASTGTADFHFVNKIVVSPNDSQRVYAATGTGIWRSLDGGDTWAQVHNPGIFLGCLDLVARTDQTLDYLFASCGSFDQATIWRNHDASGPTAWTAVFSEAGMGRTSLAVAPSNQNVVYALSASIVGGTYQYGLHAVFRSTSSGDPFTWTARVRNSDPTKLNTLLLTNPVFASLQECFGDPSEFFNQGWYDNIIAVDPVDSNRVWVGGIDLFQSDDGGANWGLASYWWAKPPFTAGAVPQYAHADQHIIVFHPAYDGSSNKTMFVGNDGGLFKTTDARAATATGPLAACGPAGSTVWTDLNNNYGVTQFYHGTPYPAGSTYFGGTQDNGTLRGTDAAGSEAWTEILGGDGGYVAADSGNTNILYAENTGLSIQKSLDGGNSWTFAVNGINDSGFQFIAPFIMDPSSASRLWTGGWFIWRTANGASNWTRASTITAGSGSVSAIAVAKTNANKVLVGMSDGFIHRTASGLSTNSGTNWPVVQPRAGYVSSLAFDPVNSNVAYATYATFGGTHIWKSIDSGASWTGIDGSGDAGIPDIPVHSLVVDPSSSSRLYVGTDIGVFVSRDGGLTWEVEHTGFANVITESLSVGNFGGAPHIFAFTHGRGVWRVPTADLCTLEFSAGSITVSETAGNFTVTVTRTGGTNGTVSVKYATVSGGTATPGSDYTSVAGTLTFQPGVTTRTFTIPIINDTVVDPDETVHIALSDPTGSASLGVPSSAVLTITDNDIAGTVQLTQQAYSVTEGSTATISFSRTGGAASAVGATWELFSGSATLGVDTSGPVTGTVTFGASQTSQTISIPTVSDTLAEGPETVLIRIKNPTGGASLGTRQTAVLTLVDNDVVGAFRFSQGTYSVSESAASFSVPVLRSNGAAQGQVTWSILGGGSAVFGADFTTPGGVSSGILPFAANATSMSIPLTLLRQTDTLADGARTIQLQLSNPLPTGFATLGTPTTTTVTIGDNDVGGTVQWNPASHSVLETAGNAVFTVTRTGGAAMGAGATWEIVGGTAVHGIDFTGPVSGLVNFDSGASQPVTIPLVDRSGAHGTRTLQVKLAAGTGGANVGGTSTAAANILDETVGFRFDKEAYPVNETSGSLTVTVLRTGPTQPAVAVTIATVDPPAGDAGTAIPGTDYTPASMLLTFGAGQTSRTFTIPLKNDMQLDGARTLKLRLSNPTGGAELGQPAEATATLGDDDLAGTFRFTTGTLTMTEGANGSVVATITVARSGGSGGTVQVPWSVIDGTATTGVSADPGVDVLLAPSGTLTFGPNELSKKIEATILSDSEVEPNETVKLALGTPTPGGALGSPSELTLVVADGDRRGTIQFTAPLISVAEANLVATIAVTRTGNLADPVTVDWAITGGSATRGDAPGADVDYVAPTGGTLSFAAGQSTPTVPLTIAVNFDAIADGTETVELTLGAPSAGWALGTVPSTIVSLVEGAVQFAPLSPVSEGSGSANITITRTGVTTQPVTVSYTTGSPGSATPAPTANACSPGADYRPVSGSQTFSPGQTTRTFSVPLCGDGIVEGDETLTLTLAVVSGPAIIGATGDAATLTITENDAAGAIRFSSATYSASEGQGNATLTVTRTGGGTGVTVHWAIDDVASTAHHGEDYTGPLEGDIDFGNLTSKSLVIPLLNTSAADGPRTIVVALSNPLPAGLASLGGGPTQATLTINDNEPTLRLNSASYVIGETSANLSVTVLRSGPASAPASVKLVPQTISSATGGTCNTSGVDFGAAVIDVEIPAGQGSRTVQVPICQDTWADGPETFGLALQDPGGATLATPAAATVTITDNEVPGTLKWSAADASGVEGTTLLLTVTRTSGTASDITVEVTAHDGDDDTPGADAQAGVDYEVVTASPLSFGLNATTQTVEISLLPRDGVQGPRAFRVTLHDPAGGPGVALGSPATATVWILDSN